MVKYVKSKENCHFALTEVGFKIPHIRSKYDDKKENKAYRHTVPESWVNNNYVVEVSDD